jgi:hypothetical protein
MTVDELIEAAGALRHQVGGNATVVVEHRDGALRVLQTADADSLAKLRPTLYGKPESQRFVERVAVLRS